MENGCVNKDPSKVLYIRLISMNWNNSTGAAGFFTTFKKFTLYFIFKPAGHEFCHPTISNLIVLIATQEPRFHYETERVVNAMM